MLRRLEQIENLPRRDQDALLRTIDAFLVSLLLNQKAQPLGWAFRIRVDEPNSSNSLGTVSSPAQATYYLYDVLDNPVR